MDDSAHGPQAAASHGASPAANDLFLSYNRVDRKAVLTVRQYLRVRGVPVFFDSENLLPGLPWVPALDRALHEVQAVAVFIGRAGIGNWQMREVWLSLDLQVREERAGRPFPVIPVLLPQADVKDASGFLLMNTWIDLRGGLDDAEALDVLARVAHGTSPATTTSAKVASVPPYRALRPFCEADAPLFFGREVFTRELQRKVSEHRLVAVVGPSGSGKSSVVQAGLLPLLRRERPPATTWEAVVFTPGTHPFHNMAAAFTSLWEQNAPDKVSRVLKAGELGKSWAEGVPLGAAVDLTLKESSGTDRLLIVLDQFEELFSLTAEAERRSFVKALLDAASSVPVTVVITLRADFYGQSIGLNRDLSDFIQAGIVNLGPMKRDELRMAVELPARSVGLHFQEGLVDRILDHIEGQPGHLPLLEFTLTELWERRQEGLLTNEQYDAIGGVEGAISKRADALLTPLPVERQQEALRTLTSLVRVTPLPEESGDTRRRARLSELGDAALPVVRSFADARLLVTGRDELTGEETVELAHEALIHAWERFRSYVDGDREFLLWRQRLNFMLDEWKHSGFDRGALLRRRPLAEATHYADERAEQLNEAELNFIEAGERALIRRRRWMILSSGFTVLALLTVLLWTVWRRSDAYQIQTVLAKGTQLAAVSRPGKDEEWLTALTYYGKADEALHTAGGRVSALAVITEALMKTGQKEEARRAADEIYAKVGKQWADSVKESFPGSDARFEAFINAANACAVVGERDAASRSLNEALTGREIDRLDVDSFSTLARLSVKTGQEGEILTSVRKSENENFRDFAVGEIAEALASAGRHNEALDAARDIKHPYVTVYHLVRIMRALDKNGLTQDARQALDLALAVSLREEERTASDLSDKVSLKADAAQALTRLGRKEEAERLVREALQIAPGIDKEKKWKQRSFAYTNIVSALLKLDNIEEAMIAYREITAQPIQMIAASKLALKLVKTGRTQEALSVASNVRGTDVVYSNSVFAAIAIEIAREGRPEEALDVTRNIDGTGEKVAMADMFRGDAFTGIAKALAGMRRYREALELADQPTVNDKLEIYSAILREYAKERNPALAKSLEVEEQDEAIFPWLRD